MTISPSEHAFRARLAACATPDAVRDLLADEPPQSERRWAHVGKAIRAIDQDLVDALEPHHDAYISLSRNRALGRELRDAMYLRLATGCRHSAMFHILGPATRSGKLRIASAAGQALLAHARMFDRQCTSLALRWLADVRDLTDEIRGELAARCWVLNDGDITTGTGLLADDFLELGYLWADDPPGRNRVADIPVARFAVFYRAMAGVRPAAAAAVLGVDATADQRAAAGLP